jgi:hypothetical protein
VPHTELNLGKTPGRALNMAQVAMMNGIAQHTPPPVPSAKTFFSLPDDHEEGPPNHETTIEALYTLRGEEPPTPTLVGPISHTQYDRLRYLYLTEYAVGMDQLFETTWYTRHGIDTLLQNQHYCDAFVGMLKLFEDTRANDYDSMRLLPLTEARMIWRLICMPRQQAWTLHEPLIDEVTQRLDIFESLLTGKEIATPPQPSQAQNNTIDYRRNLFWRDLGHLTSLLRKTRTSPSTTLAAASEALSRLRNLLDGIESRDVLYSLAAVRLYGPGNKGEMLQRQDEAKVGSEQHSREGERLAVAKKFVEDQAAGKGTNQVVQRCCAMAVRSWREMELW